MYPTPWAQPQNLSSEDTDITAAEHEIPYSVTNTTCRVKRSCLGHGCSWDKGGDAAKKFFFFFPVGPFSFIYF